MPIPSERDVERRLRTLRALEAKRSRLPASHDERATLGAVLAEITHDLWRRTEDLRRDDAVHAK